MYKHIATGIAGVTLLGASLANAVPVYESDEVTLFISGYFSANQINTDGNTFLDDGFNRIRLGLNTSAYKDWNVGFNAEWGVNAISAGQPLIIAGDQQAGLGDRGRSLFIRQGHVFAKHEHWGDFVAGKQWAVYYDVAGYTDWYEISGGLASGAFSLGSDGGILGTGRADSAITWHKSWAGLGGEMKIGLQYQAHTAPIDVRVENVVGEDLLLECPEGDCEFGLGHSISLQYTADVGDGLTLGAAYNRVKIDLETTRGRVFDITDPLNPILIRTDFSIGASSNSWALIAGFQYGKGPYQEGLYAGVVAQRSQNNELAPEGSTEGITNFFDAEGSESIFTYTWGLKDCYSFYFGHNILRSDDPGFEEALIDEDLFELKKYFIGFQYRWSDRVKLYTENTIDDSNSLGAAFAGDVIAVGMRVDI
ncbi:MULTISPECIES: porin [Microbulbifer]|uniref:porin n=1 Tax=Microbulbifer TaxID=48073 RepID=UPI001E4E524A|nr:MULTISPECIES: porin [Microbulbifer]UHQ55549.1 porin [Microbulbifer sp. YPW16]